MCIKFRDKIGEYDVETASFDAIVAVGVMLVDGVSIKICVAASSGGAIIVDDSLTLAGGKK